MDSSLSVGSRRRVATQYTAEEHALDQIAKEAEARLAARRQARAEAREIRMRELERQQKEAEENADRNYDSVSDTSSGSRTVLPAPPRIRETTRSYASSRRSSEDSTEEGTYNLRDVRHELKETEEKFRKAMIHNAQLDNEKSTLTYQVDLLKDKQEELEENHIQLQKEHKEKCREYEQLKRLSAQLTSELQFYKAQLEERDRLIQEHGLVIIGDEDSENELNVSIEESPKKPIKKALVSREAAQMLENISDGPLDVRLKKFLSEKNDLQDQVRRLTLDLEEERGKHTVEQNKSSPTMNGPDNDVFEAQREANKQVIEYKVKLQKAEQDVATLQANVARLESQLIRYKTSSETLEKAEEELKLEKRKLQRELREATSRVDELETTNSYLQKRLDKLKNAKSALLKEL